MMKRKKSELGFWQLIKPAAPCVTEQRRKLKAFLLPVLFPLYYDDQIKGGQDSWGVG